ncbi:MAG: hypothetical protein JXP34_18525 [Planctomycetes bacterium]|nr:hypothetical protein [Planctomycetota bacterium]
MARNWRERGLRRLACAALLALPAGAAEDEAVRRGVVSLSDGDRMEGEIDLPRLRVFAVGSRKWLSIDPADVARIRTEVVSEQTAQAWVFVEEGSREKIKLPEWYPIRTYESDITLRDGTVVRGRINATSFYIARSEAEEVRLILRSHEKGEKGQSPNDLVFVRELDFGERPAEKPLAVVRGRIPPGAELRFVARGAMHGFEAKAARDGSYVASGVLPGRYDAVMRAGGTILSGFPREDDPRIDPATRARLERAIDAAREFFDRKTILRLWGDAERVRAFVEMRREGPTTLEGPGGSMRVRRWEVWEIDPKADPVRITGRVYLFRELLPPAAGFPAVRHAFASELAGIEIAGPETTFAPPAGPGGTHGR